MRYTRYDFKKKKGNNILIWLIGIVVFSICIGMFLYNVFLKEKNIVGATDTNATEKIDNSGKDTELTFGIIQCGVFKDKANAEETLKSVDSESTAFIVEEDGNFKLMYGIYRFDDADKKSQSLSASSISNFRIKYSLGSDSNEKKIESEIIDGYIKIVNKITEKDVKSVETKEFKSWTNNIAGQVENPSEELNTLVSNINKLPDEYQKSNLKDSLMQLYNVLKNYKEK